MAFWEWQDTYLINVSRFDAHHQRLVALLNNLYADVFEGESISNSQKQLLIGAALAELNDYTYYHLSAEEEILFRYEFPGYVLHKKEHEQFKLRITQLMEQHKDGTLVWSFPIFSFLKDWISRHVLQTDKQYGPYLNEKHVQ